MESLARYLEERAARIAAALDELLAPDACPEWPQRLREALRYSLLNGGKRVRPVLCLASSEAVGGTASVALPAALAIEVLHTYTLVHDDLPCMDDDALRRGQPTVHVRFGEAEAVLAGDALQALAFSLLMRLEIAPERFRASLEAFAQAAGPAGVVGGQWVDVTARPPHEAQRLAYVHQHKTADLLACATRLGALAGGGVARQVGALARYGNHLGLAFQIVDDLLDAPERASRAVPELSCLDLWTEEEARAQAAAHTRQALAELEGLPGDTEPLRALALHWQRRTA